jgi:hypothetical protein
MLNKIQVQLKRKYLEWNQYPILLVKVKNENASMLKQKRRSFLFLPGFFHIIETFIDQLEKDAGKQFIITVYHQ